MAQQMQKVLGSVGSQASGVGTQAAGSVGGSSQQNLQAAGGGLKGVKGNAKSAKDMGNFIKGGTKSGGGGSAGAKGGK